MNSNKVIVFQTYRTHDVPWYIQTSMESVQAWAKIHGFEYECLGDEILSHIPEDMVEKIPTMPGKIDYCRIVQARSFLLAGYKKAVWVDADVYISAPHRMVLEDTTKLVLPIEHWMKADRNTMEVSVVHEKINNTYMVFDGNSQTIEFLDQYIQDCQDRTRNHRQKLDYVTLGPVYLTRYWKKHRDAVEVSNRIGIVSTAFAHAVHSKDRDLIGQYTSRVGSLTAINLSGSLAGKKRDGFLYHPDAIKSIIRFMDDVYGESV